MNFKLIFSAMFFIFNVSVFSSPRNGSPDQLIAAASCNRRVREQKKGARTRQLPAKGFSHSDIGALDSLGKIISCLHSRDFIEMGKLLRSTDYEWTLEKFAEFENNAIETISRKNKPLRNELTQILKLFRLERNNFVTKKSERPKSDVNCVALLPQEELKEKKHRNCCSCFGRLLC